MIAWLSCRINFVDVVKFNLGDPNDDRVLKGKRMILFHNMN